MSSIARWSYKYVATVKPFVAYDQRTGETTFGAEYDIACGVIGATDQDRIRAAAGAAGGQELLAKHIIYTEDDRPKYLDHIKFEGSDGWEEIRHKTFWEMAAFNDVPDYKLMTG